MLFHRAIVSALLVLGGSAAAFNISPSGRKEGRVPATPAKNLASVLAAGVISAATLVPANPAVAADSLVLGTPLEAKLANFGAASYPVFNSISDVGPLAEKFLDFLDKKVKAPDAADVAEKAIDGLMAIPDSSVTEYSGVLKQVVFSGVKSSTCVSLSGSGAALKQVEASAPVQSVGAAKLEALKKKFQAPNSAVPVKANGDICLPGSSVASEKLWVAQAELTLSMPKAEGSALAASIKKAGLQASRPSLTALVPAAEGVFSKNPEALKMVTAGKDVEPNVIATVQAALK